MIRSSMSWCVLWAAAGLSAIFPVARSSAADEKPQSATIELKFTEEKEGPHSWRGIKLEKDGKGEYELAGRKLLLQLTGDKLRADTNGDGVVDAKDAPAVAVNKEGEESRIRIPMQIGGAKVEYPLCFRSVGSDEHKFVIVGSAASLVGKFGKYTIKFVDGSMNGKLGTEEDQVSITTADAPQTPGSDGLPFARVRAIGKELYQFEILDHGAKLKLTPYTGPVANVILQCGPQVKNLNAILHEAGNAQIGQCTPAEEGKFVPGKYRIYSVNFTMGPENPQGTNLMFGSHGNEAPPIELKAGTNVIKLGPPFNMSFAAFRKDGKIDFTQVTIAGQSGESYRPNIGEKDTFAAFIRAGEKEAQLAKLEFS